MISIGFLGSAETYARLGHGATQAGVDLETFDLERSDFAGVIIEVDYLSLRAVAACDARAIAFVVLTTEGGASALSAFGIDVSLDVTAPWSEIKSALGVETVTSPGVPSESAFDKEFTEVASARGRVIAVWGPAGAPGRTSIAINIASESALLRERVLLIDADTYGGAIAGYLELFDEAPGFLAASRLAAADNLDRAEIDRLTHRFEVGAASISIMSGIVSPRRWPELTGARVRAALEVLREHFDLIVCDVGFNLEQDEEISSDVTSPRRNQATLEILGVADQVIAVTAADVIGVARFIQSLELLKTTVVAPEVTVVANRVRQSRSANASIVRHTLRRFAGLSDVSVINDDRSVFMNALDRAVPLCVAAPKSAVRAQFVELARAVNH